LPGLTARIRQRPDECFSGHESFTGSLTRAVEQLGQPVVPNGLPLTKLHHAAFDAYLIGIDPDFRIHVSDRLLEIHEGPFLELGLKGIAGPVIQLPRRNDDRPDRDRLALQFEQFTSVERVSKRSLEFVIKS